MRIHDLGPNTGARKSKRRLGRGTGSGLGKTSGKGHKGQWARSGGGVRPGFEGGQMPLTRRLPKFGFTNNFRKEYSVVNVGDLDAAFNKGDEVNAAALLNKGILRKIEPYGLKVLGDGELTKSLNITAAKFSKGAEEKIVKAGGKATVAEYRKTPIKTGAQKANKTEKGKSAAPKKSDAEKPRKTEIKPKSAVKKPAGKTPAAKSGVKGK